MENEQRVCTMCNCTLREDEGYELDDHILCDECFSEHTTTCDHCGETIWANEAVTDDHTTLCAGCFDDHYRRCEECGRIIYDNDAYWHGDYPYCSSCYDELDNEIEEYSYKPDPIFYGEGNRFFGIELEIDCAGKDEEYARKIKEQANLRCEHIYCKSDGSLEDGFEIVTHPMTLEYHLHEMPWASVLHEAVRLGYKSHMTTTCGLHIHINRDALAEGRDEQDQVIEHILFFVEKHWAELFTFSRRSEYSMSRWAARYGYEKTGKQILDKAKKNGAGRYCAINICPYATVEFRLFRGTLKLNTLFATLELVNHIIDTALTMTEDEIANQSWSDFVQTVTEPELLQYLRERKLYVNDEVEMEEEV